VGGGSLRGPSAVGDVEQHTSTGTKRESSRRTYGRYRQRASTLPEASAIANVARKRSVVSKRSGFVASEPVEVPTRARGPIRRRGGRTGEGADRDDDRVALRTAASQARTKPDALTAAGRAEWRGRSARSPTATRARPPRAHA